MMWLNTFFKLDITGYLVLHGFTTIRKWAVWLNLVDKDSNSPYCGQQIMFLDVFEAAFLFALQNSMYVVCSDGGMNKFEGCPVQNFFWRRSPKSTPAQHH